MEAVCGVIAITPDKQLGKTLRIALTAAGAEAQTFSSPSELPRGKIDASLVVLHQVDPNDKQVDQIAKQLASDTQMIVLLPRADLAATVAALQSHERVAGVLNADRIRTQEVTAMATRLLFGDIFGLGKVLPWGAHIHSLSVGSYDDKSAAIEQISAFATSIGVRRKYRESIEQCCDEMLMNALYDAPVDKDGKPLTDQRPGRDRPELRDEDKAVIEYGCDGQRFAVAVRDRFGRFERSVLVRYLDKCLHSSEQMDRKPGGAGLGLYLMSNSATSLMFNILPGVVTECVCTFDIGATKVELEQLGVFRELVDEHGRLIGGPDKTPPPFPIDRRRHPKATPSAALLGAAAEEAASRPAVRQAPGRGMTVILSIAVLLICAAITALVLNKVLGPPSAAQAQAVAGATPVDESGAQAALPSAAVDGIDGTGDVVGGSSEVTTALAVPAVTSIPTGSLTVHANVSGFVTVEGSEACTARPLPLEACPLADGTYSVHLFGQDPYVGQSFTIEVRGDHVTRTIELGLVEAREGYLLRDGDIPGPEFRRAAFAEGRRPLVLINQATGKDRQLRVPLHAGQTVVVP